jgi:hypothetical protein
MGGSNLASEYTTVEQPGIYGVQGVAAPGNVPGPRQNGSAWTDASGNLWLFGGYGNDSHGVASWLNDLWKYSGGEWTWMAGSNVIDQSGTYGTQGVAAEGNTPGARYEAASWTDNQGNLWLFGGMGAVCQPASIICELNDLWEYKGGQWTWVGGSNTGNQAGIYGTRGTPGATNVPGGRDGPVSWTDASGNFWLFGGNGLVAMSGALVYGPVNDLWEYKAGQWTWVSGSDVAEQPGVYGTQGTPSAANVPGARSLAAGWTDADGNLWLFGGLSSDPYGTLNDLWEY